MDKRLGPVHALLGVPARVAACDLHDQRDRVTELPAAESHQEPLPFPNDDAVVKLLWLAICNIENKRARERAKERGKPASERKGHSRLIQGHVTTNWRQALAQLAAAYPDRINPYL